MEPSKVSYRKSMTNGEFASEIREALLRSKLVVTSGVEASATQMAFWDDVSEQSGSGCVMFGEDYKTGRKLGLKWQEIRYDGSIQNAYRYSKNAQPLHTDGSYLAEGPEIVFFFCVKQASAGGETTFIDSAELIELLDKRDRGLLTALQQTPVHFSKAEEHKTRPIIHEDGLGALMTWNYYCVDPSEPADTKLLAERFHTFLQEQVVGQQRIVPVRLAPGEAVFFHDERLLHGRNAFEAAARDDRFLLKTAFNLNRAA